MAINALTTGVHIPASRKDVSPMRTESRTTVIFSMWSLFARTHGRSRGH
jgi:hypothetical protein